MGFLGRILGQRNQIEPFPEKGSDAEKLNWFKATKPWDMVDKKIIKAIINKYNGDPMIVRFVVTSMRHNLIRKYCKYNADQYLLDSPDVICHLIALLLYKLGSRSLRQLPVLLNDPAKNEEKFKLHFSTVKDSLENCVILDENQTPAYYGLAMARKFFNKNEEALKYIKLGLSAFWVSFNNGEQSILMKPGEAIKASYYDPTVYFMTEDKTSGWKKAEDFGFSPKPSNRNYLNPYNKEALRLCKLAAEQGDANSQFNLGEAYENGSGIVCKNKEEAFKWYKLAAEQGDAIAQFKVGEMLYHQLWFQEFALTSTDKDLDRDIAIREMYKWYERSAMQGYEEAQYTLCLDTYPFFHDDKDKEYSLKWCKIAAEDGHKDAHLKLWDNYHLGIGGLHRDDSEVLKCYKLAAELKLRTAQRRLANMYKKWLGRGTKPKRGS